MCTSIAVVTYSILSAAPTGPPTSVMTTSTPNAITVQWGSVDCADRNGDITGYSVQYGEVGSGSTQTMPVSGGGMTEYTIFDLTPSTEYNVSVAAVTSAGTGVYSDEIVQRTEGEHFPHCLFILNSVHAVDNIYPLPPTSFFHVSMTPFGTGIHIMIIHYNCTMQFLVALVFADLPSLSPFISCSTNVSFLDVAKLER